jgi:hypothetical protein
MGLSRRLNVTSRAMFQSSQKEAVKAGDVSAASRFGMRRLARTRNDNFLRHSGMRLFLGAGPESIPTKFDVARSWGRHAVDNRHSWLWIPGSRWRAPRNDGGDFA